MTVVPYVAGLLAATFWGVTPVITKRGYAYGGRPMEVTAIVLSTGAILLWAVVLATQGIVGFAGEMDPAGYAIFLAGGLVGTAFGRIMNYTGIDRVGASVNSAVVATNPLFATVLALLFLGELVSLIQAAGVVVVVLGLAFLTTSKGGDLTGWRPRDLTFPLLAALAYGSGGVIRRYGLTTTPATAIEGAALNETAALLGILAFFVLRRDRTIPRVPRRAVAYFVATGVFVALGILMMFVGLEFGRVSIVVTLAATSSLFAIFLSTVFLGDLEKVTRGTVVGAMLVVLGIVLITLF